MAPRGQPERKVFKERLVGQGGQVHQVPKVNLAKRCLKKVLEDPPDPPESQEHPARQGPPDFQGPQGSVGHPEPRESPVFLALAYPELLERKESQGFQVCQEHPVAPVALDWMVSRDPLELLVLRVIPVMGRQVFRVHQDFLERRDCRGRKETLDSPGAPEGLDGMGLMVAQDPKVIQVFQAFQEVAALQVPLLLVAKDPRDPLDPRDLLGRQDILGVQEPKVTLVPLD